MSENKASMLSRMKDWFAKREWDDIPELAAPELSDLQRLREGDSVHFSARALPEFAGRTLVVGEVVTYQFGEEKLRALPLWRSRELAGQLIVVDDEEGGYLAFSRLLPKGEQLQWFEQDELNFFTQPSLARTLRARDGIAQRDAWLALSYRKVIDRIEGTKRQGRRPAEHFHYSLLVSEGNERAVEFEFAASGEPLMWATVYRPLEDIERIERVVKPLERLEPEEHQSARQSQSSVIPIQKHGTKPLRVEPVRPEPVNQAPRPANQNAPQQVPAPFKPVAAPLAPAPAIADQALMECPLPIAQRLIDEALRREMSLEQVMRKVLGLPMAVQDHVLFRLPLSDADYAALGERYGLKASEREAIRQRVAKEMAEFAGVR